MRRDTNEYLMTALFQVSSREPVYAERRGEIYNQLRRQLVDQITTKELKVQKREFDTEYRLEVYVFPAEDFHRLLAEKVSELGHRLAMGVMDDQLDRTPT